VADPMIEALSWAIGGKHTCMLAEITYRKSHPLEGSCQEAILLPYPILTFFSWVLVGTLHPRSAILDASVFSTRGVGFDAPHQSPIRIKASWRLAAGPDVCPWHRGCPRKPSVPYRVQSCTAYR